MEAIKKKFADESPEDKKTRQKNLVLPSIGCLVICIAMVVIGSVYKDDCNTEAANFLLIGGGLVLVSSALNIFAYLTPCKCDDKFAELVTPLVSFVHFVVVIWGSIVVFGVYSKTTYEDKDNEYYCNSVPFKFAFAFLILSWILLPILICCSLLICCGVCCAGLCAVCCACSNCFEEYAPVSTDAAAADTEKAAEEAVETEKAMEETAVETEKAAEETALETEKATEEAAVEETELTLEE